MVGLDFLLTDCRCIILRYKMVHEQYSTADLTGRYLSFALSLSVEQQSVDRLPLRREVGWWLSTAKAIPLDFQQHKSTRVSLTQLCAAPRRVGNGGSPCTTTRTIHCSRTFWP